VRIIQADHKNFVSFILVFIALKFFLYSVFVQSLLDLPIKNSQNIGTNLLLLLGIYVVIIFIFIRIKTSIINRWRVSRYKDNLSLFSYSFVPIIFSLFILTPVEYGIFGVHWFIFNPSPFIIKEFLAYVLAFVEIMMVIWSIFLYFSAVKIQSNSVSTAIIFTCSLLSILTAALLLIPHVII
jgi:hypothetical protein